MVVNSLFCNNFVSSSVLLDKMQGIVGEPEWAEAHKLLYLLQHGYSNSDTCRSTLHHCMHRLVLICWSPSISSGASAAKLHLLCHKLVSFFSDVSKAKHSLWQSLSYDVSTAKHSLVQTLILCQLNCHCSAVWAAHLALSLALRLFNLQ